ncbi:(E)-4-hydroxy-3-methylbut-2-enyl-diphosphate synthase [Paludibacteraceae bacterium OttesenSCG-928-F17]|nr:(E)-4-hydroxy-3-methylbut-2-enyl-diphosphate synthase [Paludibacteraceae bacterium OttesenSCG-928-F17]
MLSESFNYKRHSTREIEIGRLKMGGCNPIRIQSMANTNTNDISDSVEQCIKTINAGCELMRYTTQGIQEVESLNQIHADLREKGYNLPLVADVHFNHKVAELAATYVEKVRINPGNFVPSIKKQSDDFIYSDEEYAAEFEILKEKVISFLTICKQNNTAIRIGVNHGSLSKRILSKYGDTPEGMVVSCMELLQICKEEHFENVVISLKSSNTVYMVYAVRLLLQHMKKEGFDYPIHLGVTEAGEGEDGRIKSAVGIGSLLADGIGDTIRVSLSENPECEIPVAKTLATYFENRATHPTIKGEVFSQKKWSEYARRKTYSVGNIGGSNVPVVISSEDNKLSALKSDYVIENREIKAQNRESYKIFDKNDLRELKASESETVFLKLSYDDLTDEVSDFLSKNKNTVIIFTTNHAHRTGEARAFFHQLLHINSEAPIIIHSNYEENDLEKLQIKAAADMGSIFMDGFGDGIYIENKGDIESGKISELAFGILQAARVRIFKTEYISCPGCGRTLFDLHSAIAKVKKATSEFKGLKIAIMGCIVNGPGEMADADYGYVGAGKGKVSLYKSKECIEKNIPEDEAVEKLIQLIQREEKIK